MPGLVAIGRDMEESSLQTRLYAATPPSLPNTRPQTQGKRGREPPLRQLMELRRTNTQSSTTGDGYPSSIHSSPGNAGSPHSSGTLALWGSPENGISSDSWPQYAGSHLDSGPSTGTSIGFDVGGVPDTPHSQYIDDDDEDDETTRAPKRRKLSPPPQWEKDLRDPLTRRACLQKIRAMKPKKRRPQKELPDVPLDKTHPEYSKRLNTRSARNSREKKYIYTEALEAVLDFADDYIEDRERALAQQQQRMATPGEAEASMIHQGTAPQTQMISRQPSNIPQLSFGEDFPLYRGSSPQHIHEAIKQECHVPAPSPRDTFQTSPEKTQCDWDEFNRALEKEGDSPLTEAARHSQQLYQASTNVDLNDALLDSALRNQSTATGLGITDQYQHNLPLPPSDSRSATLPQAAHYGCPRQLLSSHHTPESSPSSWYRGARRNEQDVDPPLYGDGAAPFGQNSPPSVGPSRPPNPLGSQGQSFPPPTSQQTEYNIDHLFLPESDPSHTAAGQINQPTGHSRPPSSQHSRHTGSSTPRLSHQSQHENDAPHQGIEDNDLESRIDPALWGPQELQRSNQPSRQGTPQNRQRTKSPVHPSIESGTLHQAHSAALGDPSRPPSSNRISRRGNPQQDVSAELTTFEGQVFAGIDWDLFGGMNGEEIDEFININFDFSAPRRRSSNDETQTGNQGQ